MSSQNDETYGLEDYRRDERIDVTDPSVMRIDMVVEGSDGGGWVHTHGLEQFGLPELEIRSVSHVLLLPSAAVILTEVADYLLNGERPVAAGDALVLGDMTFLRLCRLSPLSDHPDHYVYERWAVVDVPESFCPLCEQPHECDRFATRAPPDTGELAN